MRNLVAALAIALVSALGVAGPAAAAQTSTAKVVIIVGATHGATAGYRQNADAAYAEAIKYTSKVTKVYSPNATWSKVKAATARARTSSSTSATATAGRARTRTTRPTRRRTASGLNADLNGDGKLSRQREQVLRRAVMAQLGLAPNAIVMLHNLCYASGNSEPGGAAPTTTVARQRIDNYAAGFLKGNAAAVLADGHMGPVVVPP